jgi:cytoskeletal protein CcmA (bactofilin family)
MGPRSIPIGSSAPPAMFNSNPMRKPDDAKPEATEASRPTGVERALAATVRLNEIKPSIISEGFAFTGDIVSEGPLHVEGRFKGTVHVSSATIGANGTLDGTLTCSTLRIKGRLDGDVTCDDLVIDATATVRGKVRYRSITMSRGATIAGELIVTT